LGRRRSLPSAERLDDRGQENVEQRGRANEPGEDVRGPCDEPEHADDPRCTGAPAARNDDDDGADDLGDRRGSDDSSRGSSGPGPNSGPSDDSGHDDEGDDDSGHGGGHDD